MGLGLAGRQRYGCGGCINSSRVTRAGVAMDPLPLLLLETWQRGSFANPTCPVGL